MNKLRTILLSLSILTSFSLTATNVSSLTLTDVDGGWNSDSLAKLYFHNSETQRQWAWESISKLSLSGDEKILDFGCGDGKVSADMARLVKNGTVLGIDISEKMIHVARIYFPSYAFPNLQFKNSASITFSDLPGNQDYDLVSSFAVFHLISNPLEVLKNLKTHLKPSGKLLLVVPTGKNPALFQAANEIFQNYGMEAPWNKKDNPNAQSMRTLDGCAFFLKEAGYHIESLEIMDTDNPFYDLDDFIAWMMGTVTATWQIPLSLSQAFFTDVVHRMYELDPTIIDEEGRFRFKMPRIHAMATPIPLRG